MQALTVNELSDKFSMSRNQIIEICKTKGSPAFKKGVGKTSPWLCFPDKFEIFLKQLSEKYKG
ncbi:hypothetical protein [Anaerosporobacter faecicola]|uniref:hypothetical protein n=1 Tax=Anaerosporobacter faecicola TaxID=2718714 RepID=UPI0014392461|nr:hypothetical protein [Anaerosporobacter faecicola]